MFLRMNLQEKPRELEYFCMARLARTADHDVQLAAWLSHTNWKEFVRMALYLRLLE